eukprot:gene29556-35674_t
MGCSSSHNIVLPENSANVPPAPEQSSPLVSKRRWSRATTITVQESNEWGNFGLQFGGLALGSIPIKKRHGNPASQHNGDGYSINHKIEGRQPLQSFYLGESEVSRDDKVFIKEFHTAAYTHHDQQHGSSSRSALFIQRELRILSKLSHYLLPKPRELFVSESSYHLVMDFIPPHRLSHHLAKTMPTHRPLHNHTVHCILKALLNAL